MILSGSRYLSELCYRTRVQNGLSNGLRTLEVQYVLIKMILRHMQLWLPHLCKVL